MKLALVLAEHCVFENFSETDQALQLRYRQKPKPGPGRRRKEPFPEDLLEKFKEARKLVSTNEDAVQRLKSLGILPRGAGSLKTKSILRYIQKDEKEKQKRTREEYQRYLEAVEAFKDITPSMPDELK